MKTYSASPLYLWKHIPSDSPLTFIRCAKANVLPAHLSLKLDLQQASLKLYHNHLPYTDLLQFMKTSFFILIELMGGSSPEILPKNERGGPGFSLNTIVVQWTSATVEGAEGSDTLHPYSKCRYLSSWGILMVSYFFCSLQKKKSFFRVQDGVILWKITLPATFLQRHLCLVGG